MENRGKKSWLAPFYMAWLAPLCMVMTAACIFIYITHYPPIPPGNYTPQDSLLLAKIVSVVRFGYPLVGSILIVCIISSPFALLKRVRDLRYMKAEKRGQPPQDGNVIAVTGPITADHRPVATPAGGKSCIAYEYYAWRLPQKDPECNGYMFTPSSIDASFGKVKILTVPHIDFFTFPLTTYSDSSTLNNFKTYLQNCEFVESLSDKMSFAKARNILMTDRKSPFREDINFRRRNQNLDVDGYSIHERCIEEGEIVCAFGVYSASQQGLIPNPGLGDYYWIEIKPGPIKKLIRKQKFSIVRNLVMTACMLAMLTVMAWTYQNFYYIHDTLYNLSQYGK